MKIYVEVFVAKNSGKKRAALIYDFGYRKAFISFDSSLLAEILGISVRDLVDADVGIYDLDINN